MATPPASSAPSTSTPSSSAGGVALKAIMVYLMRMDACLDTLSDELCQVNTRVGCIARRQAAMGGFTATSPSPLTSENEDNDGDGYDDASSSSTDKIST